MEPPSKHLVSLLSELELCSARDLRRCRGRVRRLARDLPAFDSVWIDALVQARKLTPYQAHVLESDHPQALKVGPCVIVERLGSGVSSETYLAEITARHERCVLKCMHVASEQVDTASEGLHGLVQRLSSLAHPSFAGPFAVQRQHDELFALSHHVAGPHLGELLIRRGRFDPQVVAAIARQLLDGLCQLEKTGGVHGDIVLSNVRCQISGRMVLVDTGIKPVVKPHISYYDDSPPERYDGLAPELVGPGRYPDVRSDLYALGCLLWQLLTARPPFIHADPLLKLAAHQTQTIDDVRIWAPDTPDALAAGIARLTSRDPNSRPRSFREARELFGPPVHRDGARLRAFRSMFQSRALPLRSRSSGRPGRVAWTGAALLLSSGLVATLFHAGIRTELLNLTNHFTASNGVPSASDSTSVGGDLAVQPPISTPSRYLPLPRPDATGTVRLDQPGPYAAGEITQMGRLTIVAPANRPAVIVVEGLALSVACEQFHIENVILKFGEATARTASALLLVHSKDFSATACQFLTETDGASPTTAVGWKLVDPNNSSGGNFAISNSVWQGDGTSIFLGDLPQRMDVENSLKLGRGVFVKLKDMPHAGRSFAARLRHVTLRESGPVFQLNLLDDKNSQQSPVQHGEVRCIAENCVFDFSVAGEKRADVKPLAPLVELYDVTAHPHWHQTVLLTGEGNLVPPGVTLVSLFSPIDGRREALDESAMNVEGLMTADIKFLGPANDVPGGSHIEPPNIPTTSALPPGVVVERLPQKIPGNGYRKTSD